MAQINYNKIILDNYQKKYPNLADFHYDETDDTLIYNGDKIRLNGYGLSRIDQIFFNLAPDDIYRFFKYGFYYESNEVEQIKGMFNRVFITEEIDSYLERYAQKLNERIGIYMRNTELFNKFYATNESVKRFALEIINGRRLIEEASLNQSPESAEALLCNAFQKYKDSNQNTNSQSNELSKGMSLTRTKNGIPPISFEEPVEERFGIAGFTSIILVIIGVITFGMFLATKIMP